MLDRLRDLEVDSFERQSDISAMSSSRRFDGRGLNKDLDRDRASKF